MMRLIVSDAIDAVRKLDSASVDAVVTHPPYFMLGSRVIDTLCGLSPSRRGYIDYLRDLSVELARVVKSDGFICMAMGDGQRAVSVGMGGMVDDVADAIESAGWPLIAIIPWACPTESAFMVFGRGESRPNLPERLDAQLTEQVGYDFFQDPFDVLEKIIGPCVPEGGCVLDPFMGSGSTMRAAYRMNRDAIGIDVRPEYVKIAEQTLDELTQCMKQEVSA